MIYPGYWGTATPRQRWRSRFGKPIGLLDYPSVSAEGPEPRIGGLSALQRFNRRITEDQWLSVKLIAQRTALRRCLVLAELRWRRDDGTFEHRRVTIEHNLDVG